MGLSSTVSQTDGDFSRKSQKFSHCREFCAPPVNGFPLELVPAFGSKKNDEATGPRKKFDDIFSRLDTIRQRDRRTESVRQQRPRLLIASRWPQWASDNTQFQGEPLRRGKRTRGGKCLRFSAEIAVYLGNGTRTVHVCYWTLIGSHRRRIDPCRFRWPWVILNPSFKVTVYLPVEYLLKKWCVLWTKLL